MKSIFKLKTSSKQAKKKHTGSKRQSKKKSKGKFKKRCYGLFYPRAEDTVFNLINKNKKSKYTTAIKKHYKYLKEEKWKCVKFARSLENPGKRGLTVIDL